MTITVLNSLFLQLEKRAETSAREKLLQTFVDVGPLFTLLSTRDHQVLFGRRGTGKTHVLRYLQGDRERAGDAVAFVDMRQIGSNGGLYGDLRRPLSERATGLLVDTLVAIHGALLEFFVEHSEELDLSSAGPALDELAEAITSVEVVGTTEQTTATKSRASDTGKSAVGISSGSTGTKLSMGVSSGQERSSSQSTSETRTGQQRLHVNFGATSAAFKKIVDRLGDRQLWLVLDEWSSVPAELQPYLADLIRRSLLPLQKVVVKIAAIEHRSDFMISGVAGDYLGIEIGADVSAGVNLDDFMVFDNDEGRAKEFFASLVFAHTRSLASGSDVGDAVPVSKDELLRQAFTEKRAVEEYVRASEGVPRDAINILVLAAQYALDEAISVQHVRKAALNWYHRDKAKAASGNAQANALLHWIISEVIGDRKARAFLVRVGQDDDLVRALHDARVLHIIKRSISSPTNPGERYTVYKLDYGCYVDLISTARAPKGLLPLGDSGSPDAGYVDVPPDDYRSIRRAILSLEGFYADQP